MAIKDIVILGSGNVATHLAPALAAAGGNILQVYSRKITRARKLAKKVNAKPVNKITEIHKNADLYLFAISDGAIEMVGKALSAHLNGEKKYIVAHTSGATPSTVFKGHFKQYGIFYPLQTFSKNRPADFQSIPFCIDGNRKLVRTALFKLAEKLSSKVYEISDQERSVLHVAAVFANNFTNHLFTISKSILDQKNIPFDLLLPLILETAQKVQDHPPETMQTGPAIRNDRETMERHLRLLEGVPEVAEVYRRMSEGIMRGLER